MAEYETSRPRKKMKPDFFKTIQVLVGSEKSCFVVYKDTITRRSPFFDAACKKHWNQSEDAKPIELPDDDPEIFTDYLQTLYGDKVQAEDADEDHGFLALAKAYILADKLGDLQSANLIIDKITIHRRTTSAIPGVQSIVTAFERASESSPLRRLLVNIYIDVSDPEYKFMEDEQLPHSFLIAFFKQYKNLKTKLSGFYGSASQVFEFQRTVEVLVGEDSERFVVHAELFCQRSGYFRSLCSANWKEEQKPIGITLPDPSTFNDYLKCVYHGCFYSEDKIKRQDVFLRLAQIHVLATWLRDLETANTAVDEIIRYSNREELLPLSKTIKLVMKSTVDDSPLQRLMVDLYVHEADPEAFEDDCEEMPNTFLVAVGKEFRKKVCENEQAIVGDIFELVGNGQKCRYHQHDASCPQCEGSEGVSDDDSD
ncbi:hypothetical protein LTR37_018665 [Vermiconidia calcicola]|uniref:Uncharacterized protein n=1 Tax=Vermiconidia calcicola TaxID=1690605 RepID=A0ACC3MHK3_9PEZI|nr:hypothetical protein LTR37_018665 [Vermiconidia calcicola]